MNAAELNRFQDIVVTALSNVDQSYYSTTYDNIDQSRNAAELLRQLRNRMGRIDGTSFIRYSERVFCYEFYHHLRVLHDAELEGNAEFLENSKLQAEVKKMQILDLIELLGNIQPMNDEYIPDFLLHSPGTTESHPFVIEVKSDNRIDEGRVLYDLLKINQFITRYRYERGIFISVNTTNEYMDGLLAALEGPIRRIEGRASIKVINKENQNAETRIWQL